jgi:hypothetical protein
MSQGATSCYLYEHRSWPIDVSNNRTNTIYFYPCFYPSFSTFSSFHRLDLLSAASTPWVSVVLAYLPSRCRLAGGEATSSSASGAPDCHRNRQNWTIRFAKPNGPVFPVSSRSFRLLFDSCGNTFWRLCRGINYFKHVKHEGWKLRPQRIRPQQGQHPQAHL